MFLNVDIKNKIYYNFYVLNAQCSKIYHLFYKFVYKINEAMLPTSLLRTKHTRNL